MMVFSYYPSRTKDLFEVSTNASYLPVSTQRGSQVVSSKIATYYAPTFLFRNIKRLTLWNTCNSIIPRQSRNNSVSYLPMIYRNNIVYYTLYKIDSKGPHKWLVPLFGGSTVYFELLYGSIMPFYKRTTSSVERLSLILAL